MPWIFVYGSLMWDNVPFSSEERIERATLKGFHREFNKGSWERWGTRILPGPTLGLESGGECPGTLFEISNKEFPRAIDALEEREGESFKEEKLDVVVADRRVKASVFVNKRTRKTYIGGIPIETRVHMIREAKGKAGQCLKYVRNIAKKLHELGIVDPHVNQVMDLLETLSQMSIAKRGEIVLESFSAGSGPAFERYREERLGREEKYLRMDLGSGLVLFKNYFSEDQVDYWLYKRLQSQGNSEVSNGVEQVVGSFGSEFEQVMPAGHATFLFRESNSVCLAHIQVDELFRRGGLATWLTRFHIDSYYPEHGYNSVWAEARTDESKRLSEKLGLVKVGEDRKFGHWYMRLDSPKKLHFPEGCTMEALAERIRDLSPRILH